MTKDEAIGELSVLYERFNNGMGWRDGRFEEALDIAINALEDIEAGDLINRADAIEAFDRGRVYHKSGIEEIINALPSADAVSRDDGDMLLVDLNAENGYMLDGKYKVNGCKDLTDKPQGEWVRKEKVYNDCDGRCVVYWYECDQCGARPPKDQWKNEWHSNYCPSCGARMKGGAE